MRIPKKIKIGGHVINVVLEKIQDSADGKSDTHENKITIDSRLPASQQGATLIHEALHMMNATWSETQMGHIFLESISQQIWAFLSDNKLLKK